ncbi:UPF0764 protein C16orf89 [Agrilus planipennis]|uniref:UPF0764 protein C16orf89 n=1 Tax=Agrilus planipennis TaxID=224129 RepID=A0A1W4WRG5_AGRPL|nr:UPF0764 protein C16orf89 [Agrilus planipennis]
MNIKHYNHMVYYSNFNLSYRGQIRFIEKIVNYLPTLPSIVLEFILQARMYLPYIFVSFFACQSVFSLTNIHKKKSRALTEVEEFANALDGLLNFASQHYDEINFDGALGLVLAEANLYTAIARHQDMGNFAILDYLIHKIRIVKSRVLKGLQLSNRYRLFGNYLLRPSFWSNHLNFNFGLLTDYGMYNYSDFRRVIAEKNAVYKGVKSDDCLEEILNGIGRRNTTRLCYISPKCHEMMLADRTDVSYLLTHRLFYLQILRGTNCTTNINFVLKTQHFCSLILREAKTNEYYGFPQHDLFLEQVSFCGMEGFSEFLIPNWRRKILWWQSPQGCYKNRAQPFNNKYLFTRSENNISYGCTDHTTGLGAAALALNLRFLIHTTPALQLK